MNAVQFVTTAHTPVGGGGGGCWGEGRGGGGRAGSQMHFSYEIGCKLDRGSTCHFYLFIYLFLNSGAWSKTSKWRRHSKYQ